MKKIINLILLINISIIGFSQESKAIKETIKEVAYFNILKSNTAPRIFNNWEIFKHDFNCTEKGYYQIKSENFFLFPLDEEIKKVQEVENLIKTSAIDSSYLLANANVLDFLLENKSLIPSDWKMKKIYFRGSLFQDKDKYLIIRYLYFSKEGSWEWSWDYYEEEEYFIGKIALIKK